MAELLREGRRTRLAVAVLFWLVVWHLAAVAIGNPGALVGPLDVGAALIRLIPTSVFWLSLASSALRIALGFGIAMVAGSLLGYVAHRSVWADALLAPVFRLARTVPVAVFTILVLMWAGPYGLAVTVPAVMVAPIVYANVREGLQRGDDELRELAELDRATPLRYFTAVTWPSVCPYLVAACNVGVGLAWKAGVSAEVIGLPGGSIGEVLSSAREAAATPEVLAWTVLIVTAAYLCERLVLGVLAVASPEAVHVGEAKARVPVAVAG
ncbi:MAG: ABC transporter permease subunit [Cellulomonadaceae bacterium]|jgi:NitT/TauT family transport system permease protein|nr:ABC transporter permease subunit [Cellulomonadaceae bacterium]